MSDKNGTGENGSNGSNGSNGGGAMIVRQALTPQVWQMIEAVAPAMHQSRLFGVTAPEQAAAIMLKGYELGLGLAASFEFIQVIKGKPGISPRGALALVHSSGQAEVKVTRLEDAQGKYQGHSCWMRRRDSGFEYTAAFTLADGQRAGLVKPDSGWEKYPENMCLWRAVGFAADVVVPDVIGGMKRTDELGADITPEGDTIEEAKWTVVTSEPKPEQQQDDSQDGSAHPEWAEVAAVTLNDLVGQYGADVLLAANGGKIPATSEEVAALAKALAGGVA